MVVSGELRGVGHRLGPRLASPVVLEAVLATDPAGKEALYK